MSDHTRQNYRALSDAEKKAMANVKASAEGYIAAIKAACPAGREQSLAITNAEQSVMWAVKGITG